jgi:hypothetical protein
MARQGRHHTMKKYPKITTLVLVGALGFATVAAADAPLSRQQLCDEVGGTYAQPGPNANQDTCTVAGDITTVDDGDPYETGRGEAVGVGEPVLVSEQVGESFRVNAAKAKVEVRHTPITRVYSQATEVEVEMTQDTVQQQQVTVHGYHPNQNRLSGASTHTVDLGAGAPVVTYETVAGDPMVTEDSIVCVSNPGKGAPCPEPTV